MASTKPMAATVLPAPVACSNQKRLAALGSSGASSSWSSSSGTSASVGRLLVLVGASSSSSSSPSTMRRSVDASSSTVEDLDVVVDGEHRAADAALSRRRDSASASSAVSVPDSASTWCGFSSVPSARRGSSSESRRSSPSSERPAARPLRGRVRERPPSSSRSAASSARRRWLPGARTSAASSPGVHEALARELLRALDLVGGGDGRGREGHWREISQGGVLATAMSSRDSASGGPGKHDPGVTLTSQRRGTSKDVARPRQEQCTGPRGRFCQAGRRAQVARRHRASWRSPRSSSSGLTQAGGRRAVAADRPAVPDAGRGHARRWPDSRRRSRRCTRRSGELVDGGRRRASTRELRGPARHAGRREPVGVVVRAVPLRDPLHPAPVPRARDEGRVPRRELRRLRRAAPRRMVGGPADAVPVGRRRPRARSPAASARAACRSPSSTTRDGQGGVRAPGRVPDRGEARPRTSRSTPPPHDRGPRGTRRRRARRGDGDPPRRCSSTSRTSRSSSRSTDATTTRRTSSPCATATVVATCRLIAARRDRPPRPARGRRVARAARGSPALLLRAADEWAREHGARPPRAQRPDVRGGRSTSPPATSPSASRTWRPGSSTSTWSSSLPEIRVDPLTGERAIVAGERAGRPNAGLTVEPAAPIDPESDPFAPGHEDQTPPEVWALRPDGGAPDTPGWTRARRPQPLPRAGTGRPGPRALGRSPTCSRRSRRAARTR